MDVIYTNVEELIHESLECTQLPYSWNQPFSTVSRTKPMVFLLSKKTQTPKSAKYHTLTGFDLSLSFGRWLLVHKLSHWCNCAPANKDAGSILEERNNPSYNKN